MNMEIVEYCTKFLRDSKICEKLKTEDTFILGLTIGLNGSANFVNLLPLFVNFRIIRDKADFSNKEITDVTELFIKGEYKSINDAIHTLAKSKGLEDQLINKVERRIRLSLTLEKAKPIAEEESKLKGNNFIEKKGLSKIDAKLAARSHNNSCAGESPDNKINIFNAPDNCGLCRERIKEKARVDVSSCYHGYHKGCVITMIKSRLESGNYELVCPFEDCNGKIILKKLLKIIASEEIHEILKNNFGAKGVYDPEKVRTCKTEGCPYFDIIESDFREFSCPFCNNDYPERNLSQELCIGNDNSQKMVDSPKVKYKRNNQNLN